jgi:hypothetical protein
VIHLKRNVQLAARDDVARNVTREANELVCPSGDIFRKAHANALDKAVAVVDGDELRLCAINAERQAPQRQAPRADADEERRHEAKCVQHDRRGRRRVHEL